jgi:hypothetical protein
MYSQEYLFYLLQTPSYSFIFVSTYLNLRFGCVPNSSTVPKIEKSRSKALGAKPRSKTTKFLCGACHLQKQKYNKLLKIQSPHQRKIVDRPNPRKRKCLEFWGFHSFGLLYINILLYLLTIIPCYIFGKYGILLYRLISG